MDHIPSDRSGGTRLGGGHSLSQCYVLSEHFRFPTHITGSLLSVSQDQITEEWAFNSELVCVMGKDVQLLTTQTFILLLPACESKQSKEGSRWKTTWHVSRQDRFCLPKHHWSNSLKCHSPPLPSHLPFTSSLGPIQGSGRDCPDLSSALQRDEFILLSPIYSPGHVCVRKMSQLIKSRIFKRLRSSLLSGLRWYICSW